MTTLSPLPTVLVAPKLSRSRRRSPCSSAGQFRSRAWRRGVNCGEGELHPQKRLPDGLRTGLRCGEGRWRGSLLLFVVALIWKGIERAAGFVVQNSAGLG